MAPRSATSRGSPDPGAVDYQSGELQSASRLRPSRWFQRRSLLPRVGGCLWWSLACSLDDAAHLLGVEGLHGRGPDVAEGAGLQRDGGGCLVVGEVGDRDDVVCAKGPDQLANLAAALLDQAPVVLGSADAVAVVLDALVGPVDEGDVERHGPAPFLCRKELAEAGILSSLAGNGPAKSTSVRADRQGSQCPSTRNLGTKWRLRCRRTGAERRIGHAAVLGPSWGRETAVTHGQPRCPADSKHRSSTAVSAVIGAAGPYMACKGSPMPVTMPSSGMEPCDVGGCAKVDAVPSGVQRRVHEPQVCHGCLWD